MGWGVLEDPRTESPPGTAKIGATEANGMILDFLVDFHHVCDTDNI